MSAAWNVALRKESVDRNEYIQAGTGVLNLSLSARRAWIEIQDKFSFPSAKKVALRKESVDRNGIVVHRLGLLMMVALRKESVDRNTLFLSFRSAVGSSLSARRAWIEMMFWLFLPCWSLVALRKESVDRNKYVVQCRKVMNVVALRKESVDRNISLHSISCMILTSLSARRAWIEMSS